MSHTTTATASTTDRHTSSTARPALAAIALGALMSAIIIVRDLNDGPAWRVGLVLGAAVLITTGIVFGLVVRPVLARRSGRASAVAALVLGVVALLSFGVFWLAVPPVFGVAAVALALDARDRRPFRGAAMAGIGAVLGVLATVAGLVFSLVG